MEIKVPLNCWRDKWHPLTEIHVKGYVNMFEKLQCKQLTMY